MAKFTFTAKADQAVKNPKDTSNVAYLMATGPVSGGMAETGVMIPLSGTAYATGALVPTTGTSEATLHQYTLPANTLSAVGKAISIKVFGTTVNDAQVKTVKVYLGSALLTTTALTVTSLGFWSAEFIVVKTGASTQAFTGSAWAGATATANTTTYFEYIGTASQTDTADILIKTTGTTALAGSTVSAYATVVQALN